MARYCDAGRARARGDLVVLDADEMLRLFLIGSRPDPHSFDLIIGGLIRRAAAAGRPVRLYGEMVALLWDAGHARAAIDLEGLWNDLGRHLPFSLLCGYPAQAVSGVGHAGALKEICALHGAAFGAPRISGKRPLLACLRRRGLPPRHDLAAAAAALQVPPLASGRD